MFKKTEESEWTRFSRALGNRDQPREAEPPPDQAEIDPAESQPTMVSPPTPAPEPVAPIVERRAPVEPPVQTYQPAPVPVAPPPPPPQPTAPRPAPQAAPPSTARPMAVSASHTVLPDEVPPAEFDCVVGEGTAIEGNVRSRHSIRIMGSVQGEIESKGNVIIETDATVNAKLSAENILIRGVVNGELTCPGRIEITDTGRLIGGINGGILVMHEGAYFEGHLKMTASRSRREGEGEPSADADQQRDPLIEAGG